ncbi:unnamed protein product, partial [marine sediment metagenome]
PKRYWSDRKQTAYNLEGKAHLERARVRRCRLDHHTCGYHFTQTEAYALTTK